jgi:hypothetical protein
LMLIVSHCDILMSELISRREVHRRPVAQIFYDFEAEYRRQGWGDFPFVYDEEKDLFRSTDGRFAFSHEHADWTLLRKRGRMRERIAVDSHRYLALIFGGRLCARTY